MTDVYVLQLVIIHDGTYTEGVTMDPEYADRWVAEMPHDWQAPMYSQQQWRQWSVFTPMELTDEG